MPQLTIPPGSRIDKTDNNTIEIKVKNTKFWVIGEKKENHLWDAFLFNPTNNQKELLRKNVTTKSFSLFSNIILKTPFPYIGKRAETFTVVKKFIKNLAKNKQNVKRKRRPIRS